MKSAQDAVSIRRGAMKARVLTVNRRARRFLRGRSRGFSLIEVVIAMLLLGIIGVSVLTSLSYALGILIAVDREATAEGIARSQMEYVKSQPYGDEYLLITAPQGYEIAPVAVEQIEDGLQKITVTVTYTVIRYNITTGGSEMIQKDFVLEDYKRGS